MCGRTQNYGVPFSRAVYHKETECVSESGGKEHGGTEGEARSQGSVSEVSRVAKGQSKCKVDSKSKQTVTLASDGTAL